MSAHVLLNIGEKDKMKGFAERVIGFPRRV